MGPSVPTTVMAVTFKPIAQRRRCPSNWSPISTIPTLSSVDAPIPCTRRRPRITQKSPAKKQALPAVPKTSRLHRTTRRRPKRSSKYPM